MVSVCGGTNGQRRALVHGLLEGPYCGYADPAREQQSWVLESASQGQRREGEVGIDGIDG